MKRVLMTLVLGLLSLSAMAETPWLVRARAVYLDPADKSDPMGGVGASDRIHVSDKTIPEVDISWFFTPNIAVELMLTYPQKHKVTLDGSPIGSFRHLPPGLIAQYHFAPEARLSPYVGLGVNWTTFSKNRMLGGAASLEHDSVGPVAQAGVDVKLGGPWSLNFDVKKVRLRSDVRINGVKASTAKVDPLLLGVGIGYRF
jgi:outer membrane protein